MVWSFFNGNIAASRDYHYGYYAGYILYNHNLNYNDSSEIQYGTTGNTNSYLSKNIYNENDVTYRNYHNTILLYENMKLLENI